MFILQMTGLSGAGKTTLAVGLQQQLMQMKVAAEVIDADVYRKTINSDLGFNIADRKENIRRLGLVADQFCKQNKVAIIAAINPFEDIRQELREKYQAKLVWIKCSIPLLIQRDTKGLYYKALLPDEHPDKLRNLSGINDPYELPVNADLTVDTTDSSVETCLQQLTAYCISLLPAAFFQASHKQ